MSNHKKQTEKFISYGSIGQKKREKTKDFYTSHSAIVASIPELKIWKLSEQHLFIKYFPRSPFNSWNLISHAYTTG